MTTLSRRRFLAASGVGLGTLGAVTALGTSLSLAAPGVPNDGDTLVVLFLAGGADGLSTTPPYTMGSYYDERPTIAVGAPGTNGGALRLDRSNSRARFSSGFDGLVGLHPSLKALHDGLWADGKLAVIPAAGLPGSSYSHFQAFKRVERGSVSNTVGGGWLARMLNAQGGPGPIAGAFNGRGAASLVGSRASVGLIGSLDSFALGGFRDKDAAAAALASFNVGNDAVSFEGRKILSTVDQVEPLDGALRPGYDNNAYGRSFSELSTLLKADPTLGIRAATIKIGGWDMHRSLGRAGDTGGNFWTKMSQVGNAIAAFASDTNGLDGVTVVVMSEFGRTINENGNAGTDHGQGTTYLVAGNGIRGGVYGDDFVDSLALEGRRRGAVPYLTDYRKVLGELVRKRAKLAQDGPVFPGFSQNGSDLGLSA
ncbi:MAG: DUF1501 domain-containing protein [Actinomycetota bacterium]